MSTCGGPDIHKLLVLTVILYTMSTCMATYSDYLFGYKKSYDQSAHSHYLENGLKKSENRRVSSTELTKTINAISFVYNISNKSFLKNNKIKGVNVFKFKKWKGAPNSLQFNPILYRSSRMPMKNIGQFDRRKRHAKFSGNFKI